MSCVAPDVAEDVVDEVNQRDVIHCARLIVGQE